MITNKLIGITIRNFRPEDQHEVKQLILSGLLEHWGTLDKSLNPDLDDISASYRNANFIVTYHGKTLVGCGALIFPSKNMGHIVRMSVHKDYRRLGIGTLILKNLISTAFEKGLEQILLETTSSWHEAIKFYQNFGFQISHFANDDVFLVFSLEK